MAVAAAVVADMLTMTAVVLPVAVVAVTAMVGETMDGKNRITGPTAALVGAVPLVAVMVAIVTAPNRGRVPTVVMMPMGVLRRIGTVRPFWGTPMVYSTGLAPAWRCTLHVKQHREPSGNARKAQAQNYRRDQHR